MLIYCNGDSFVAGVELGDDILPDYPGLVNYSSSGSLLSNSYSKWLANTYNPNHPLGKERERRTEEIRDLEYQRAFPNKLSKKLNIPVINHAAGGSSMDRIVRTTIADLISLKETHDNIVAIIGDTECSRFDIANFEFLDGLDSLGLNRHWLCVATTYHMEGRDVVQPIIDYNIRYEKNYHMLVKYYTNVIRLQDFCKVNDIKLYWITPFKGIDFINVEDGYDNDSCYSNLVKYANLEYVIRMRSIAEEIYYNVKCPSGHYGENVHEEVANRLANIIKEDRNVQVY